MTDKSQQYAKHKELLHKEKVAHEALIKGTPPQGSVSEAMDLVVVGSLEKSHELAKAATEAFEQEMNKTV